MQPVLTPIAAALAAIPQPPQAPSPELPVAPPLPGGPLPHAQAAERAPIVLSFFLDDADKRVLFGVPEGTFVLPASTPPNPFYYAVQLSKSGQYKEAENVYHELLNGNLTNVAVHAALGMLYATQHKSGLALRLLEYALEHFARFLDDYAALGIKPQDEAPDGLEKLMALKRSEVLNAIGTCYKNENITDKSRDFFEQAQQLVPPNADIQNNIATLFINEGRPEEAIKRLDTAIALKSNHAQAHWNRALALLELGRYREGWIEYDWGIPALVRNDRAYHRRTPPVEPPLPYWDGTPGKRIVLFGEQGIGDELLFMSCLPDVVRDSELVIVDCHKKLHRLLAHSFPDTLFYPTREDNTLTWPVRADGTSRYHFNAKCAVGSLPRYYRNDPADCPGTPFLRATPDAIAQWATKLATLPRRPNIGISWRGGHKRTRMEVRSIPLAQLEPILRAPVNWISLQYTPCEDEIAEFTKVTGIPIHHWPGAVYSHDYNDTAGLVANLDLVISVATSVIHLAGGLGIPCWVLTASRAAWREYYGGDRNPWYNALTMFRQENGSVDWAPVIDEVARALAETVPSLKVD